ncbi:MAG: arylsulfatase A-like enzyme, partial [Myxococcota bacterium]
AVESAAEALLLEQDDSRPLFLFVNLMPAHAPYHLVPVSWTRPYTQTLTEAGAPPHLRPYLTRDVPGIDLQQRAEEGGPTGIQRYLGGDLRLEPADLELLFALYDGELVEADMRLNAILSDWVGAHPGGIVSVTSDHGEAFGERGRIEHRGSVYSPMLSVPLLIAAPGRLEGGQVVTEPVPLAALGETLLSLAELFAADAGLRPVIAGGRWTEPIQAAAWPDPYRAPLGAPHDRLWRLYRVGDRALVFGDAGEVELYDVGTDPLMLVDIAASAPAEVARLRAAAEGAFPESEGTGSAAPSSVLREQLEELGYLEPR